MMNKSTAPVAVVCLLVGFAAAWLLMSGGARTVHADCPAGCPGAPGTPCDNCDVNADGKRDLSDAVYLLSHLFLGGPEPVPFPCDPCDPCDPCPSSRLPATGQTRCYTSAGAVADCDNATYPRQDGLYQAGCPTAGRFVNHGETVTDNCTGLMWQQATAPGAHTWQSALNYCQGLDLAGYTDWRLPNVRELHSIVDYGRVDPSIDPVFSAIISPYWSSTTNANYPMDAWHVYFGYGNLNTTSLKTSNVDDKGNPMHVRAVRTVEPSE